MMIKKAFELLLRVDVRIINTMSILRSKGIEVPEELREAKGVLNHALSELHEAYESKPEWWGYLKSFWKQRDF